MSIVQSLSAAVVAGVIALPAAPLQRTESAHLGTGACTSIAEADVDVVPHGFLVQGGEFVAQDDVLPSSDGGYWFCAGAARQAVFLVPADQY
jgi:hypothetical protein